MADDIKQRLHEFYTTVKDYLDRCVDFWYKHSLDKEHGGFFSCLDSLGKVYDTTKHSWLLCRQVWMFARLYHETERFHLPHVLEAAKNGAEFAMKHVRDPNSGKCYLKLTAEGRPIKTQRTIFSEAFYTMAMSEMYRVTKEDIYKNEATRMMQQIVHWVREDNSGLGLQITPPVPVSSLSVPMVILMLTDQLGVVDPDLADGYHDLSEWCVSEVLRHVGRSATVILENVTKDGTELSGSAGRLTNPGHAIECGWFLLKRAIKTHDQDLAKVAIDVFITKSYNLGWDPVYGGLFYFVDVDGCPPLQLEWDMKLWWPHNEAMIAFLMAYKQTRDEKYLIKFAQVFDYSFQHFLDSQQDEWIGYLSREGNVKINAKGGEWKDDTLYQICDTAVDHLTMLQGPLARTRCVT